MKWIHNEKVSLAWAVIVELVVHGIFAFGAFSLGGFVGEIILGPKGQVFGGVLLAVFIFGAAFQAFVLGEYMREHVKAFENTSKGDGSYIRNWNMIQWIVGGLEVASLAFRCIVAFSQGNGLQAIIVALFGGLALWYAYAQAKVIHASVNRPAEHDVRQAQNAAKRDLVGDALKYRKDMSPEQKARFAAGDTSAVEEVYQARSSREDRKRRIREQQEEAKNTQELARQRIVEEIQKQDEQASETASNLFNPKTWRKHHFPDAQVNSQANHLSSQNGKLRHEDSGIR